MVGVAPYLYWLKVIDVPVYVSKYLTYKVRRRSQRTMDSSSKRSALCADLGFGESLAYGPLSQFSNRSSKVLVTSGDHLNSGRSPWNGQRLRPPTFSPCVIPRISRRFSIPIYRESSSRIAQFASRGIFHLLCSYGWVYDTLDKLLKRRFRGVSRSTYTKEARKLPCLNNAFGLAVLSMSA